MYKQGTAECHPVHDMAASVPETLPKKKWNSTLFIITPKSFRRETHSFLPLSENKVSKTIKKHKTINKTK